MIAVAAADAGAGGVIRLRGGAAGPARSHPRRRRAGRRTTGPSSRSARPPPAPRTTSPATGHWILPGFIDGHIHGVRRHRRAERARRRGDGGGGPAAARRDRLLSDDHRLRAGDARAVPRRRGRAPRPRAGRVGPGARRAPRKQLPATPTTTARSRRRACGCRRGRARPRGTTATSPARPSSR